MLSLRLPLRQLLPVSLLIVLVAAAAAIGFSPGTAASQQPFACESNGGELSWTDDGASRYWVYKSTDGVNYTWIGRTLGATTFTDTAPVIGATYQVHHQNLPRIECTITAEPGQSSEPFACSATDGVITWSDDGPQTYWVYRSPDGVTYSWLGTVRNGGLTFTDPNPAGASYQVHYQGLPRIFCDLPAPAEDPVSTVPGPVEAESFTDDYLDTDAGNRGSAAALYSGDVDVWGTVGEPGFTVGRIRPTEFTTYEIEAAETGLYSFSIRTASGNNVGGEVTVSIDGNALAPVSIAPTGGWWTFASTNLGTASLTAGRHNVRVTWGAGQVNFDRLDVVLDANEPPYTPPPPGAVFDYQIGGSYPLQNGATIVSRDWRDSVPANGAYNICYVNAFQTQPDYGDPSVNRPDETENWKAYEAFPGELILEFEDPEWAGEFLLDISTAAKRNRAFGHLKQMMDECASKGYDAIEFDNLDTYKRMEYTWNRIEFGDGDNPAWGPRSNCSSRPDAAACIAAWSVVGCAAPNPANACDAPPFGRDAAVAFAKLLTDYTHSINLASAQKNTIDLFGAPNYATIGFDFAVVEQCGQYTECGEFVSVFGDLIVIVEYTDGGFAWACANYGELSIVRRDVNVLVRPQPADPQSPYVLRYCDDSEPPPPPPPPPLVDNLLQNGNFDVAAGWQNCGNAARWAIGGGQLTTTAASDAAACVYQNVDQADAGVTYALRCDSTVSSGYTSVTLTAYDSNFGQLDAVSKDGVSISESMSLIAPQGTAVLAVTIYSEGNSAHDDCALSPSL